MLPITAVAGRGPGFTGLHQVGRSPQVAAGRGTKSRCPRPERPKPMGWFSGLHQAGRSPQVAAAQAAQAAQVAAAQAVQVQSAAIFGCSEASAAKALVRTYMMGPTNSKLGWP